VLFRQAEITMTKRKKESTQTKISSKVKCCQPDMLQLIVTV